MEFFVAKDVTALDQLGIGDLFFAFVAKLFVEFRETRRADDLFLFNEEGFIFEGF